MFPDRLIIICCKLIGNDGLGIRTRSIVFFQKGNIKKTEGRRRKNWSKVIGHDAITRTKERGPPRCEQNKYQSFFQSFFLNGIEKEKELMMAGLPTGYERMYISM